jgi:DNA-binding GntR family transcriptional regulator
VADAIIARDPPRARDEMFNLIEGALNLLLDAGKDPKRPA